MKLFEGEKITGGPTPNILGYFHPECAKKYFANKEQPSENNNSQRIKEKILRNLDKICLDPMGELANAENAELKDISRLEIGLLAALLIPIVVIGFYPNLLLGPMQPAVQQIAQGLTSVLANAR